MPDDALGLCGKTGAFPVHTRVDYMWAVRIPNAIAPRLNVGKADSLPGRVKSPLPLDGSGRGTGNFSITRETGCCSRIAARRFRYRSR